MLDLGGELEGNIQTVEGRAGSPTLSLLSLVLTRTDQSGLYTCSPSNTAHTEVTVHIVQGEAWGGGPGGLKQGKLPEEKELIASL